MKTKTKTKMRKKDWCILAILFAILAAFILAFVALANNSSSGIDNNPEPAVHGNSNILVAYFSWSGNSQELAHLIAEETGGDLFRIVPKEAYPSDYNTAASRAQTELNNGTRPTLSDFIDPEIMENYDTIYLGFPVWWYDLPTPVWTFLEEYDFSGKTILPFFSHNGSADGANSLTRIEELATGATILTDHAFSIQRNKIEKSEQTIREWAVSFLSRELD